MLSAYGYTNTDDLDLTICATLESGALDTADLLRILAERHSTAEQAMLTQRFRDAWDFVRASFEDNVADVASATHDSATANAHAIHIGDADGSIRLLRSLGRDDLADSLLTHWVRGQVDAGGSGLDLDRFGFRGDVKDPALLTAVAAAVQGKPLPSLETVVVGMASRNGWNPADEQVLLNATEEQLAELFRTLRGSHRSSAILVCLRFGQGSSPGPGKPDVTAKPRAALLRIGEESALNGIRVGYFGVSPAPPSGPSNQP